MTIYWIIISILLLVALLIIALPLWKGRVQSNAVLRDAANLEIFRDQVAEMDADLRSGLLTQDMYDQGKQELQLRLLDEVKQVNAELDNQSRHPYRGLAAMLVVLIPLVALGLYSKVGNPDAIKAMQATAGDGDQLAHTESELHALEAEVNSKPDDGEAQYRLARSYSALEHYEQAVKVYEGLTSQYPQESQLWADYADALAMTAGRSLMGKPTRMLEKSLQIDPDNFKALALSGSAAMERKDYAEAAKHWERLLKMIPPESSYHGIIAMGIQKAQELQAQNGGSTHGEARSFAGKEAISGIVSLSSKLRSKTSPDDTVFVLARAAEGPRMPLAIVRKQVKDLPIKFTLDDSMAMSPQMRLSNFSQVVVVARISKSGNAMTQPGDLQGNSAVIKPGTRGLKLQIDEAIQ